MYSTAKFRFIQTSSTDIWSSAAGYGIIAAIAVCGILLFSGVGFLIFSQRHSRNRSPTSDEPSTLEMGNFATDHETIGKEVMNDDFSQTGGADIELQTVSDAGLSRDAESVDGAGGSDSKVAIIPTALEVWRGGGDYAM